MSPFGATPAGASPNPVTPRTNVKVYNIPLALQQTARWVCWKWVVDEGGNPRKVPIDPKTGNTAKSNDPGTWAPFDVAHNFYLRRPGIAGLMVVFTDDDDLMGNDLDECIDEHGIIAPAALDIISRADSYTEISPRGRGVKVFMRASWHGDGNRTKQVTGFKELEVYERGRFFTVTGDRLMGTSLDVEERQSFVDALAADYFPPQASPPRGGPRDGGFDGDDQSLLERMFAARNGAEVRRLWNGDTSMHGNDDSAADMALAAHLAFWIGDDPDRIERLMRCSGLRRDKWDNHATYLKNTIARAIARCPTTYTPHRASSARSVSGVVTGTEGSQGDKPGVNGRTFAGPHSKVALQAVRGAKEGRVVVAAFTPGGELVHRDTLNPDSANSRTRFVAAVAAKITASDEAVAELADALLRLPAPIDTEEPEPPAPNDPTTILAERDEQSEAELSAMPPDIIAAAEEMLLDPNLIDRVRDDIVAVGVVGEETFAITTYVQGTSRLLKKPVSILVQGTSSSGKSFVLETVSSLFPKESVLRATDFTPNSLYYLPFGTLMHTWVIAGERKRTEDDNHAEAKRAMREMISAGELRKAMPVKGPDGKLRTEVIYQPGPIAFSESTTSTAIFDEDSNRCLLASTDESAEQTSRVVLAAGAAAAEPPVRTPEVVLRHQALQRLLRRVEVRIPFARKLAEAMPKDRPEARRAIGIVISMIRAVATLHQRQRSSGLLKHGDVIHATVQDYAIAARLLAEPMGRALGKSIPEAVARFGRRLMEHFGGEEFSSTEALDSDTVLSSKGKVNQYLVTLAEFGVTDCVEANKGQRPARWRIVGAVPEGGSAWLPCARDLSGESVD